MSSEVLKAAKMPPLALSVVTQCGLVGRHQCSGGTYCLYLQDWTLVSACKSTLRYNSEGQQCQVRCCTVGFLATGYITSYLLHKTFMGAKCDWESVTYMNQSAYLEADGCQISSETPRTLWTGRFITFFVRAHQWTLSWASWIHFTTSYNI
jgi:hypothetical protein